MGIKEVKQEILNDAKKEANQFLKDAESEKNNIMADAEKKIETIKSGIEKNAQNTIEQYKIMSEIESKSTINRKKLEAEQIIIDTAIMEAKASLGNMSLAKRKALLEKMIKKIEKSFSFGKVYCSKNDIGILKKYRPLEAEIIGGVILEDKHGRIRLDLSFESILESVKRDNIGEMAKILFD